MCGDLDEDETEGQYEAKLYARFLAHARVLLPPPGEPAPSGSDAAAYMEQLFCDVLARCIRDAEALDPEGRYDRLALQPVVFARLAGFIAGHLALGEDPLRKVMEALMLGYDEAGKMDRLAAAHHHADIYVHD